MIKRQHGGAEDVKKDEEDPVLKEKANIPTGLLAIHVFGCNNLYLDKDIIPDHYGLYVSITIGCLSKCTSVQSCYKKGKVIWDEVKNFSILVSNKVTSDLNKVHIAVIGFDKQQPRPKYRLLGKVEVHLHKMVKKQWSMDSFEMQNKKKRYSGDISIEFAFAYGIFGYGFSEQLKGVHSPKEMVEQSAFPKLDPPGTTFNTLGLLSIPRKVPHPKFIPFKTKVTDLEPDISPTYGLRTFNVDLFKKRPVLEQKLTRLNQQCAEYSVMSSRTRRIDYLKNLLLDKDTIHSLNKIEEQESDSDDSVKGLGTGTSLGLTGALAQMANMTFLAGAPGIMERGRKLNPHLVPSSSTINEEDGEGDGNTNGEKKGKQSEAPGLLGLLEYSSDQPSKTKLETDEADITTDDNQPGVSEVEGLQAGKGRRRGIMADNLKDKIQPSPGGSGS